MTVTPIFARPEPTTAPHHPLVAAILAVAEAWDGDLTATQAHTIAAGLVGEQHVQDVTYIASLFDEASGIGTGAHGAEVPEQRAHELRSDAAEAARWLATTVLNERSAS